MKKNCSFFYMVQVYTKLKKIFLT